MSWSYCALIAAMSTVSACGGVTSGVECAADTDCKGDRICNAGQCMAPNDAGEPQDATVKPPADGARASMDAHVSHDAHTSMDARRPPNDANTSPDGMGPPDAGSISFGDVYAPLPPQPGDAGFNAIYAQGYAAEMGVVFLPLFSEPDCLVVPPYGEYYAVSFDPSTSGPTGTFEACASTPAAPCYQPQTAVGKTWWPEIVDGGMYTLSEFDDAGIASGKMNTNEGIVPLIVKRCP
jgi:hypothetical protein